MAELSVNDLPSREAFLQDGKGAVAICEAFASGRLVDREVMKPMYRQGGLSGAWYPMQPEDEDEPDGYLILEVSGRTDD